MSEFALLYCDRQLTELLDWIEAHTGYSGEAALFLLNWVEGES
jgi:hypothetical protein